jgi:alpha/beta superfamily hydrolase
MSEAVYQERVRIPSAHGHLAGELAYGLGAERCMCLLVNPHPYMGGHMENNIVRALALGLARDDMVTLRFDYSGVGESDGPTVDVVGAMAQFWATGDSPRDPQMLDDVRCAADWLRGQVGLPLALAGYSFGAHAMQAALADDVAAAVVISPTIRHHDFAVVAGLSVPKLVIYSDNDFAATAEQVEAWLERVAEPRTAHRISGGEHFYRGREDVLCRLCREFLAATVADREGASCPS